ncbi:MAG: hypothetical protein HUJ90_01455 [Bacteroidales bacterium]|nr:hypothetical protein [Bacteroidales bacterium]
MEKKNPYYVLAECLLPEEIVENFDLIDVRVGAETVDVYLDEKCIVPDGYQESDLRPNGFAEATEIRDFPLRGKKMTFHVRRRRWLKMPEKTNVVKDWQLVAEGTRHSKEFAAFLKGMLGEIPDYGPLA